MKRVAIFGNAGGGKSTLARKLAEITGLPLHPIDKLQFQSGGTEVPHEEYLRIHASLVEEPEWIIDGFGGSETIWLRLEAADTLIHVDLPLFQHGLWVTKRLVKGLFRTPEGWPKGSPIISSSMSSYRVLRPCHRHLTPRYRAFVSQAADRKQVVHLRSRRDLTKFLDDIRAELQSTEPH